MARMVALFKTPKDAAAFDKHYFEKHVPLAKKIPGLRKYEVNKGPIMTPQGPSGLHLIAVLHFDSVEAIQKAFASPEGQATGADAATLATGGAEVLILDTREV